MDLDMNEPLSSKKPHPRVWSSCPFRIVSAQIPTLCWGEGNVPPAMKFIFLFIWVYLNVQPALQVYEMNHYLGWIAYH